MNLQHIMDRGIWKPDPEMVASMKKYAERVTEIEDDN